MAARLPMPRISLKRRPSARMLSPGLSSVPASMEPSMTDAAPAASALTRSPEYLTPPSAMTGTSPAPRTASTMAAIWGTPTPAAPRAAAGHGGHAPPGPLGGEGDAAVSAPLLPRDPAPPHQLAGAFLGGHVA